MSHMKPGMDARQLMVALAEVSKRLRAGASEVDEHARREISYRARHDAVEKSDQMRADARVVDAAHDLLKRALG